MAGLSEYKGVLARIISTGGIRADLDVLWAQKAQVSRSLEETSVKVLDALINIKLGDLIRRIETQKPPITESEAVSIRLSLRDLRTSGQSEITALNSQGGNALIDSISVTSVFVTDNAYSDPNNPIYIGVPRGMRRA